MLIPCPPFIARCTSLSAHDISSPYYIKLLYTRLNLIRLPLLCLLLLVTLTSCATVNEGVIFPDKISSLSTPAVDELADNSLSASINASLDDTWKALISILKQHVFIVHVDRTKQNYRTLGYIDRITLSLDSKYDVIETPFQVVLEEINDNLTSMNIICRWDLITSADYVKNKVERFEDLKNGMLTEAYLLINRVNVQIATLDRWQWIKDGEPL